MTWTHLANEPVGPDGVTSPFNGLWCTDRQHIWFGTSNAFVWRSTDGGEGWSSTTIGTSDINALAMRDDSVGILCAGLDWKYEPIVFARTTDGGSSWSTLPSVIPDVGFAAAFPPGSSDAWIGGGLSVARSHDNGATWALQPADQFSQSINAISFSGRANGWVVTDQGQILRYHDRSTDIAEPSEPGRNVPIQVQLQQNYPNPFNPTTTIRYALPHRSHVTLTVFNTLGQKVTVLVNSDMDAGYHEIQFNAINIASGVYFYRILAGSYVETKKLLIVR